MKKRIIAILFCGILVLSLTACKGNAEEDTTISSTSTTETTSVQTTTEPTTELTTEATTTTTTTEANTTTTAKKETTTKKKTTTTTKKQTTTKKAAKETTTKKKAYDPDPAYGTVKFSYPEGNYKVNHWSAAGVYWIWDGNDWNVNINISGGMHNPCNKDDFINRCIEAFPKPNKEGKTGEKVGKNVWIWN